MYTDDKGDVFSRDPFVVLMEVPCIGGKTFLQLAFPLILEVYSVLKNYLDLYLISDVIFLDDSSDVEISEIAIVAIHTSPNVAVKEIEALDEVRKWVTKR